MDRSTGLPNAIEFNVGYYAMSLSTSIIQTHRPLTGIGLPPYHLIMVKIEQLSDSSDEEEKLMLMDRQKHETKEAFLRRARHRRQKSDHIKRSLAQEQVAIATNTTPRAPPMVRSK